MKEYSKSKIINVVFMIQYIPSWQNLKPIYEKMLIDDRFNPILLCVPFRYINEKDPVNENDVYNYFIEHGYKNAINSIENGKYYDIRKLKPTYVFQTRPYNALRPKYYSSKKIRKISLICNVMYGPRLVKTIVAVNDDYFMDTFCYFSFDDEENSFYKKRYHFGIDRKLQFCFPFGQTCLEKILIHKISESERKKIIWTPRWSTDSVVGGSNFFKYKDVIFDLAKEYKCYDFIIRPHPLMFNNFISKNIMTKNEVDEYIEKINKERNVFLDSSKEYVDLFCESSLLITDYSSIFVEYYVTNKSIIYCNPEIYIEYTDCMNEMLHTIDVVNNKEELLTSFKKIIKNDFMQSDRSIVFSKYFSKSSMSSNEITNFLANIINSEK